MNPYRIVVADDRFNGNYEQEREALSGLEYEFVVCREDMPPQEFLSIAQEADALLVNLRPIPEETISHLRRCRIISRYGIGVDNVDVEAATAAGIWVSNVPDYGIEEVSDHAAALLLACARLIMVKDRGIRAGKWNHTAGLKAFRLHGKVLGIVGYGRIARAFHRKMKGFGFARTLVYDPYIPSEEISRAGGEAADLFTLLREADYISIHAPLTKETRHLIGEREIGMMKPTAVIVNTSRGAIIDQQALERALEEHRILGAGLDVFEEEPLPTDSPLRDLENVVLSDHSAYYSEESLVDLKRKAALNVKETLLKGRPLYPVNNPGS